MKSWSPEKSDRLSYNSWLREESQDSLSTLRTNMDNLQVELLGLHSALASEITMEPSRVFRVTGAINHLIVEIHLLAILKEMR